MSSTLNEQSTTPIDENAQPRHVILGTAGHIDHGKTSLIRALTGTDTDRLPEEKRRGMTIELGFAELRIGDIAFGVVDVPGHEKFVRTMVAGATGVDVALIVVAADDSVMPQTIEHIEVLDLLGVQSAVVALTKCDLVDQEMIEIVEAEIAELLAQTRFTRSPIIPVSSTTGDGLDALRAALCTAASNVSRPRYDQPFRMPVDRAFIVAGRGTVVTGSIISGRIARGENVAILPSGKIAKVREAQSHNRDTDDVATGQRAAINLAGVDRDDVPRGSELTTPDTFKPTRLIDARLRCVASRTTPILNHALIRVCLGTREVLARCVCLDAPMVESGCDALVQLRCREPVVTAFGQRFIVRDENASATCGGGVMLRAAHRRTSSRMSEDITGLRQLLDGEPADRIEEVMRYHGFAVPGDGALALGAGIGQSDVRLHIATLLASDRLLQLGNTASPISAVFLATFERRIVAWLDAFHRRNPDDPGCRVETLTGFIERRSNRNAAPVILRRLVDSGAIKLLGPFACVAAFAPKLSAEDERVLEQLLAIAKEAGFQPPSQDDFIQRTGAKRARVDKLVKLAAALGELVPVDGNLLLHAECEQALRTRLATLFAESGPFTVSQMRECLDTSRKYAVPLAEYLDRIGFTERRGDARIVSQAALESPQ